MLIYFNEYFHTLPSNELRDVATSNKVYACVKIKVINFVLEISLFFLNIVSIILALRIMKGNGIADGRIILANSRVVSICVTANVDKTL